MRKRWDFSGSMPKWVCGVFALFVVGWMAGCEKPSDNSSFDYVPPSGSGAIIVDNLTPTGIQVYVDGTSVGDVGEDRNEHFDTKPGEHRVVLDQEKDGHRSWGDDIDILDGRLTILRVTIDTSNQSGYIVTVEID